MLEFRLVKKLTTVYDYLKERDAVNLQKHAEAVGQLRKRVAQLQALLKSNKKLKEELAQAAEVGVEMFVFP